MKKRGLALLLSLVMTITGIINMPLSAAAGTFSDEPLVFGVEYLSMTDEEGNWNEYELVVPADGTMKIWGVNDTDVSRFWAWCIEVLDEHGLWKEIYSSHHIGKYEDTARLQAGKKYRLSVRTGDCWGGRENENVRFRCNYTFTPAIGIKAASYNSGTAHVTFPGSRGIKGYEVKYKVKGTNEWKVESIVSDKTLNTDITGLVSGTYYYIKARAWTEDGYGHRYFSKWSKSKKVKVK